MQGRRNVLVLCDKSVAGDFVGCLADRLSQTNPFAEVHVRDQDSDRWPGSVVAALVQRLVAELRGIVPSQKYLVVRHLDLMCWSPTDAPLPSFNEVVYWLSEYSGVTKLAFWDPTYPLPAAIEALFPVRLSLQHFRREDLWKLVGAEESQLLSRSATQFTVPAQLHLYHYLSGLTAPEVRRVLRDLHAGSTFASPPAGARPLAPCGASGDPAPAFGAVRKLVRTRSAGPPLDPGVVSGYASLQQRLRREVIDPFFARHHAQDEAALTRADALIPRGLIFQGPAGTGKSEWAKWLADQLHASLFVMHGPELKHKHVGETERAIREMFAHARKAAPSVVVIDEMDSLTPRRDARATNFEVSMAEQLLTEMQGLRRSEAVLVVGTTNLPDAIDPAFLRPGRFGLRIRIGYPEPDDRRAILTHYFAHFRLTGRVPGHLIEQLVELTEGPVDPEREAAERQFYDAYIRYRVGEDYAADAGRVLRERVRRELGLSAPVKFSADHLRGICLYLLRELPPAADLPAKPPEWEALLGEAVASVRAESPDADTSY